MRKLWQWNLNNSPVYWFAQGKYGKGLKIWVKGILIVYGILAVCGFVISFAEKIAKKESENTLRDQVNEVFANYKHNHSKEGI